jgi:membrane protease YdiL (CAAX protease family)
MAFNVLKKNKLHTGLKLILLFIIILIAAFVTNAMIIIGINIYYNATIHDSALAATIIDSALNSVWVTFATLLLQNAAFIVVAWLFMTKVEKWKVLWNEVGLDIRPDTPKLIVLGLSLNLLFSLSFFSILLLAGATSFVSFGTATFGLTTVVLSFVLMAFGTLAVGFGEEILFRGYLQNMLTKKYGFSWALPIASVFFVAVHILPKYVSGGVELLYFLSVFPIALVLGYLFYATKSLWASIAFHALEDFMVLEVFMTYNVKSGSAPLIIISNVKEILISNVKLGNYGDLVGLVIGSIVFLVIVAYFRNKRRTDQIDKQARSDEKKTIHIRKN